MKRQDPGQEGMAEDGKTVKAKDDKTADAAEATPDMLPREVLYAKTETPEAEKYRNLKEEAHIKSETLSSQEAEDLKEKIDSYVPPPAP